MEISKNAQSLNGISESEKKLLELFLYLDLHPLLSWGLLKNIHFFHTHVC